jgi:hypothetical protein
LENNNTILLHDLKSFAIAPPTFLFDNIKNKIEEDNTSLSKTLKSLFDHTVMPPTEAISFTNLMTRIKSSDELNSFKPLSNFEVAPPFSFDKLMKIIKGFVTNSATTTSAKVIPFSANFKRIAAAAAILFMCFVGYLMYQKSVSNLQQNGDKNPAIATTPSTNTAPTNPTIADSIPKQNTSPQLAFIGNNGFAQKNNYGGGREGKQKMFFGAAPTLAAPAAPTELLINGSKFTIVDNDYLATFASFNESNLPAFLQVDNPVATQITIDDYASITITEGMGAMMKKMYKTKKSGKPTRRARKQREKLEKWKRADSAFFNPNVNLNPLDPIDLGDFILYK